MEAAAQQDEEADMQKAKTSVTEKTAGGFEQQEVVTSRKA